MLSVAVNALLFRAQESGRKKSWNFNFPSLQETEQHKSGKMDGFCEDNDAGSRDRESEHHEISDNGGSGGEGDGGGSGNPFGSEGNEKADRILYVRNLNRRFVNDGRLLEIFGRCGPVESARVSKFFVDFFFSLSLFFCCHRL